MTERRAVVVAGGPVRNPTLISDLESLGFDVRVTGIPADQVDWDAVSRASRISRSEVACKAGHADAYRDGRSGDWLLVCEDDADIRPATVERAAAMLAALDDGSPTVVSLYLGPWSVVRVLDPRVPVLDCVIPPDGAVCYFINAAARELAANRWETLRPADWPLWARQCRFLMLPGGAVPLAGVESLVARGSKRHRRALTSPHEAALRIGQLSGAVLLSRRSRSAYGPADWWFWELRQRLLWRMPALAGAQRSASLLRPGAGIGIS